MGRFVSFFVIFTSSVILFGCANVPSGRDDLRPRYNGLIEASYLLADGLEHNLTQPLAQNDTLIVATFVDAKELKDTSNYGSVISEQVSSRFTQRGYKVLELKLRTNSILMKDNGGSYLLSRNIQQISDRHNAAAVIVGTYGEIRKKLYVTAKIVRPLDNVVLSAMDIGLPLRR